MGIFDERRTFKPYEYPNALHFREAIKQSRWDVEEFKFLSDKIEFLYELSDAEKSAIKRCLLAISQIEVKTVKRFWANIGNIIPKQEFDMVGLTFAENEIVHAEAYSKLLEVLELNDEFDLALQHPVIKGREDYLTKYLKNSAENAKQAFTLNLALFSLFIENVSLFSQFAIIKSFKYKKNLLKDVDTVVEATMKEETVHAQFGVFLIDLIKKEYPEWFDEDFYTKIERACKKAFIAEVGIIEWIFENGEIPSISKADVIEFIKGRFNDSLQSIGGQPIFEVNKELLNNTKWLNDAVFAYVRNDFFNTQGTNYTKYNKTFNTDELF